MTELLFLTHNRRAFTQHALTALRVNTDWTRVSKLWLFDDSSTDGTLQLVEQFASQCTCETFIVRGGWGSPVDAMGLFLENTTSQLVAKIDNDTMLPPGWLLDCERLMEENTDVDLLGIEARGRANSDGHVQIPNCAPSGHVRKVVPAEFIGGIGVFRNAAFRDLPMPRRENQQPGRKWFGWQHYQHRFKLRAAWIEPSLEVFLLDRMNVEPWRSLSKEYVRAGWQRQEPYLYGPQWKPVWEWAKEMACE